jgi:hypothetical protein
MKQLKTYRNYVSLTIPAYLGVMLIEQYLNADDQRIGGICTLKWDK